MTLDQINSRLEELKEQKTHIEGMETEVYARIVGYYRSVRNWNKGKKSEYAKRLNFSDITTSRPTAVDAVSAAPGLAVVVDDASQHELGFTAGSAPSQYLYFYRKTCPNCPPVSRWLGECGLEGRDIDVDRESGMHEASRFDVTAAPTVVILDAEGREMGRGNSVAALEAQIGLMAVAGA